jgi:hypothetical protein
VRHVFLAVRRLVFYRSWMVLVRVTIWGQVPVQGRAKTRSCNNKSTSAPRRSLRLLCWPLVGFGQRCSGAHCDTTVMPVLDRKMLIVECLGPDAVFLPACLPACLPRLPRWITAVDRPWCKSRLHAAVHGHHLITEGFVPAPRAIYPLWP